jgi:hypothetical protein
MVPKWVENLKPLHKNAAGSWGFALKVSVRKLLMNASAHRPAATLKVPGHRTPSDQLFTEVSFSSLP